MVDCTTIRRFRLLTITIAAWTAACFVAPIFMLLYDKDFLFGNLAVEHPRKKVAAGTSVKHEWLEVGKQLFVSNKRMNGTSALEACTMLDELEGLTKLRRSKNSNDEEKARLFTDCLDSLERSQQGYRELVPGFQNRTCINGEREIILHCVWDVRQDDEKLPPTTLLGMLSMVLVHPEGCAKLHVWVANERTKLMVASELGQYMSIESFVVSRLDFDNMCDRIGALHPELSPSLEKVRHKVRHLNAGPASSWVRPAAWSDIVRVFLLAAYGGVYLDCDMVLLRPLTPLLSVDFYYRWTARSSANTACFHLKPGSTNAYMLMHRLISRARWTPLTFFGRPVHSLFDNFAGLRAHPQNLYQSLVRMHGNVVMLPSAYFDPAWILYEGYYEAQKPSRARYGIDNFKKQFFEEINHVKKVREDAREYFFRGAFAYHFHNQWRAQIVPGSTGDLLLKQYMSEGKKRLKKT